MRNLGLLYTCMSDYHKAEIALSRSLELVKGKNLTFEIVTVAYVGFNYLHTGDFARAQLYLEKALQGFEVVEKIKPHRTVVLHGLSLLHTLLHKHEVARDYAQQALQFAEEREDG